MFWLELRAKIEVIGTFIGLGVAILYIILLIIGRDKKYRGKIGKIIKNYNNDLEIAYKDGILKTNVGSFIDDNYDVNGKQYKASYNIIDILEVGDYVNEVKVINIDDEWITMSDMQVPILKSIANGMIKSVITHEQMEQMSYEVVEKNKLI